MKSDQLRTDEYATFYQPYISMLNHDDLHEELEISLHEFIRFVREIPMEKHDFQYAPGKWKIKDIIQHLIDAERVFSYRALRIARNDKTPLPGFEENDFANEADGGRRTIQDLLTEYATLRHSTMQLFRSFTDEELIRVGTASGKPVSVRAIGFIIIGHLKHHQQVFVERYLNA